jgi:hypothetical protein
MTLWNLSFPSKIIGVIYPQRATLTIYLAYSSGLSDFKLKKSAPNGLIQSAAGCHTRLNHPSGREACEAVKALFCGLISRPILDLLLKKDQYYHKIQEEGCKEIQVWGRNTARSGKPCDEKKELI